MSTATVRQDDWTPDWSIHPGEFLAEQIEARGMSQAELARLAGLSPKLVSTIVSGQNPVTAETALRLERVLGMKAYIWTGLQARWDLDQARHKTAADNSSGEWLADFPVLELKHRGVLPPSGDVGNALLGFLAVGSPNAIEARMANLAVHHRQSKKFDTSPYHVLTWLLLGEATARKRRYPPYDQFKFEQAVSSIRSLTLESPEVFGSKMVDIAAEAGVAIVFEPPISKTCLFGSARWIDGELPIIQMSLRMKTNDHFWWTFFHEAGHVMLHKGKTFADDQNGTGDGLEREADEWAEEKLVGKHRFRRFKAGRPRSAVEVHLFAREVGIHPGIVVGMLQHAGVMPYKNLNALKDSVGFAE